MSTVVIAMSGGVDSSIAAALLKEQGHNVIGMMMRLWSETGQKSFNRCCTPEAMALARQVAGILDIPFYAIDAQDIFFDNVVQNFIQGYTQGITPNPCLECNRQIRWGFLLKHALSLGADYLATGHYVRKKTLHSNEHQLLRGIDPTKDQSYVLHVLNQNQLSKAIFPLGDYSKSSVREISKQLKLPISERSESQDLCFLAGGDYRNFLLRHSTDTIESGPILDLNGQVIGDHAGIPFYTIGQRKGLGISSNQPLYVIEKDIGRNALIVGNTSELERLELTTTSTNWIAGRSPESSFKATIKIRYRAKESSGIITPIGNNKVHIRFNMPHIGITPGQAAVFYNGDVCLGGGIIEQ
jgi:tRNA-specific 2-thiouridylase